MPDGVLVALGAHEPAQDYLSFVAVAVVLLPHRLQGAGRRAGHREAGRPASSRRRCSCSRGCRAARCGPARDSASRAIGKRTGMQGRNADELPKVLDSLASAGVAMSVVGDLGEAGGGSGAAHCSRRTAGRAALRPAARDARRPQGHAVQCTAVERARGKKSAAELALHPPGGGHHRARAPRGDGRARAGNERVRDPGADRVHLPPQRRRPARRSRRSSARDPTRPPCTTTPTTGSSTPNDVIVMDIGASYKGYAADVTRTVPASGNFSPQQRADLPDRARRAGGRRAAGEARSDRAADDGLVERRDRARARAARAHRVAHARRTTARQGRRRASVRSIGCTTCTGSGTASASRCTTRSSTTSRARSRAGSAFTHRAGHLRARARAGGDARHAAQPRDRGEAPRGGEHVPQHRRAHRGRLHRHRRAASSGSRARRARSTRSRRRCAAATPGRAGAIRRSWSGIEASSTSAPATSERGRARSIGSISRLNFRMCQKAATPSFQLIFFPSAYVRPA